MVWPMRSKENKKFVYWLSVMNNAVLYPAQVIPDGMHGMGMDSMEWGMDSMEWGMDSMEWGMDSILFPYGFHDFPNGFHELSWWIPSFWWVDSMDFPYGMSPWNHSSTYLTLFKEWNLCGLHMEWHWGINKHLTLKIVCCCIDWHSTKIWAFIY